MERLSSGLRINSAKDDAAGLAISTGMSSQVRGLNQAVRNANDGISMAQTAEGSMDEMTNILQRMRELSVQAANDTNSSSNRASIQIEIDQLYSEMDRIAETTSFNGINLLDGSNKSTSLHIGSESGQSLSFSIDAVTTRDLNLNAVSGTGELNSGRTSAVGIDTAGDVTINGSDLGVVAAGANSAALMKAAVNAITGASGVSAEAYNVVSATAGQSGVTDGTMTINTTTIAATGSMQELVDTINRDVGGVTASLDGEGALQLSNDTGNDIIVGGAATGVTNLGTGLASDTYTGYVALNAADGEPIELGKGTAGTDTDLQQMGFVASTGSGNVTGANVGANTSVLATDKIQINGVDLGAVSGTTAADKAFAINAISGESGVTASATTSVAYEVVMTAAAADTAMIINGVSIDFNAATVLSLDDVVTAINTAGIQGVVASADEDTGSLVLTSQAGQDIKITDTGAVDTFIGASGSATVSAGATNTGITTGKITLTGDDGADVIVTSVGGAESSKATALAKIGFTDVGGNETAVGTGLSVNTVANANNTIDRIDDALDKISDGRANLGAIQNRLSSTISNLSNVSQNISAANSRIRDADFAAETSALSKSQVLQQAGTAMLSQANASTQSVF
jgi:flagellin